MKKITIVIAMLCAFQVSFAQELTAKLDTLVSTYARLYKFNGSVLVEKAGTILLNKGYGYRNAADKVLNNEQSIFQLGSITKQFTSAIILKLQEEKKLSVEDKLSKYFPQYPKGDSITIEQLLTHTSGIYNYTNDGNFMANEVAKPANREKIMALFKDKPLDFSPGTGWNYSNSGYSMLGYIIEAVTKKPYEEAVHSYIFNPLHMTHSGFDFTHLSSKEKAKGYFKLNDKDAAPAPIVDSSVSYISFVSMIAPSPDWFMGLHDTNLFQNNKWVADLTINIMLYDAGTEDGDIFGYDNPATIPQQNISFLSPAYASVLANANPQIYPIGTVKFIKN